jgi:ribosome assembly protein YihI (activator of Der GTPase)
MPSSSAKQARTMAAAAHNPKFAKKVGIPLKVAKEFNQADKGKGLLRKKK